MDAPDTLQPVSRPPVAVIAVSTIWCMGGCLEFIIWFIERELFYLLVTLIAAVFTVLVLKGVRWVFWAGLGQFSLALGITILQLQFPGWAHGTPSMFLWIHAFISVGVIILHQLPSLRRWFGIRGSGKRWQVTFWLFVAGLTALGQYVLPTLKSLRG